MNDSFEIPFETLFPGSTETGTITGHGDTVTVGDVVTVTFHQDGRTTQETFQNGRDGERIAEVVITGVEQRDGFTSVYVKNPATLEFLPHSFGTGRVNGGWWRTFTKAEPTFTADDAVEVEGEAVGTLGDLLGHARPMPTEQDSLDMLRRLRDSL